MERGGGLFVQLPVLPKMWGERKGFLFPIHSPIPESPIGTGFDAIHAENAPVYVEENSSGLPFSQSPCGAGGHTDAAAGTILRFDLDPVKGSPSAQAEEGSHRTEGAAIHPAAFPAQYDPGTPYKEGSEKYRKIGNVRKKRHIQLEYPSHLEQEPV
jgi:hypothetical protein